MRTNPEQISKSGISGIDLKLIACISMLIDHAALMFGASGIAELLLRQVIGRLAFPIFAFLLVEGFLYTRNAKKYFCNLFLFALLSELPYDLAILSASSLLPEFSQQNTLFTLSLGLLMLICATKTEDLLSRRSSDLSVLSAVQIGIICLFGLISTALHFDYGFFGIACIGAMYLYRRNRPKAVLAGCICLNLNMFTMPGAFFSYLPISCYNGRRGKRLKYFFYFFYPLHLLLLFLLKRILLSV